MRVEVLRLSETGNLQIPATKSQRWNSIAKDAKVATPGNKVFVMAYMLDPSCRFQLCSFAYFAAFAVNTCLPLSADGCMLNAECFLI
jgi:hypothetical protein